MGEHSQPGKSKDGQGHGRVVVASQAGLRTVADNASLQLAVAVGLSQTVEESGLMDESQAAVGPTVTSIVSRNQITVDDKADVSSLKDIKVVLQPFATRSDEAARSRSS